VVAQSVVVVVNAVAHVAAASWVCFAVTPSSLR